ncbi:MAG: hypothetical protein U0075_10305 [Thermomicrobiales bacterium]
MDSYPLVVLANEPSSYRSLLAAELPFLRPDLRVLEVHPADLGAAVTTFHPSVVILSRDLEEILSTDFTILVLSSNELDASLQTPDGIIANPRLSDILCAIDRVIPAERPVVDERSGRPSVTCDGDQPDGRTRT